MTDLDDLTSVYSSQVHAVRSQITKFGEAYWDSMPNYRAGAVEEMIDALVPRVTAGQLRIADLAGSSSSHHSIRRMSSALAVSILGRCTAVRQSMSTRRYQTGSRSSRRSLRGD